MKTRRGCRLETTPWTFWPMTLRRTTTCTSSQCTGSSDSSTSIQLMGTCRYLDLSPQHPFVPEEVYHTLDYVVPDFSITVYLSTPSTTHHKILVCVCYRYLSHTELSPLRAPLIPMEHCTTRFFEQCDADNDKYIALEEWANCFGIKEREY